MPAEKRTEKTHFAAASAQLVYCSIFTSACQLVFAPQTLFFATFFAILSFIFMNTFSGGDKRTASADFSFLGSPRKRFPAHSPNSAAHVDFLPQNTLPKRKKAACAAFWESRFSANSADSVKKCRLSR
jgi:lipoprotein